MTRCSPGDRCNSCTMAARDRKSTRLNSSHLVISYAVFCLKKKKEVDPPYLRRLAPLLRPGLLSLRQHEWTARPLPDEPLQPRLLQPQPEQDHLHPARLLPH